MSSPAASPSPELLDELAAVALEVATAAAEVLAEGRGHTRRAVETKSSGTDMVTEIDRASEALVVARLSAARPDDGVLGEEGTATVSRSGVRWIIDPLDGTTNYLYDFPSFAVSVGAAFHGVPVVGVVIDVAHNEVYSATTGRGSWLGERRLAVNPEVPLGQALVGTGFAYDPARRALQGATLAKVVPEVRDIRRAGAAAVDLCWVATGRLDAYYEYGLAPWDHAAGALIATEAGATVSTLDGGESSSDVIVAAPPTLHASLTALLRASGAQ